MLMRRLRYTVVTVIASPLAVVEEGDVYYSALPISQDRICLSALVVLAFWTCTAYRVMLVAASVSSNIKSNRNSGSKVNSQQPLLLDCLQVIPDLSMLVNDLLPFEFEAALAQALCRCNVIYIPKAMFLS